MTPSDRAALREAASKATPGPWTCHPDERDHDRDAPEIVGWDISSQDKEIVGCEGILGCGEANARYIAAAHPAAVAWLVSEADAADALRAENARLREALAYAQQHWHHMIGTDSPAAHHQINARLIAALGDGA